MLGTDWLLRTVLVGPVVPEGDVVLVLRLSRWHMLHCSGGSKSHLDVGGESEASILMSDDRRGLR